MNDLESFNRMLYLKVNAGENTPAWLIQVAIGLADMTIYLIPLLLLIFFWKKDQGLRNLAIKIVLVVVTALTVNLAIRTIWPHPRPFMIGLGKTWLHHAPDASFPSNHMTLFISTGLTLLLSDMRRLGFIMLLMGLGTAWARIFLGVHFPLDMIGAVGTSLISYLIWIKNIEFTDLWKNFMNNK